MALRRYTTTEQRAAVTKVLDNWYQSPFAPNDWLHQSATSGQRWPFVECLCDPQGTYATDHGRGAPNYSIAEWLEALVADVAADQQIAASKSAIHTASLLPDQLKREQVLGNIILIRNGDFVSVSDRVYLPTDEIDAWPGHEAVHDALANDSDVRKMLKDIGVKEASAEVRFDSALKNAYRDTDDESRWSQFWRLSRQVDVEFAQQTIAEKKTLLARIPSSTYDKWRVEPGSLSVVTRRNRPV